MKNKKLLLNFFLIVLIILPVRLYKINQPLKNITSFRQAQTATVALNFYKNGINFFKSELDIFGIGSEKYLTLEFPIYQAIVATLYKLFFVHDMFGRLVSVISGFISSYALYLSVLLLIPNRHLALLSAFFFLAAPLNMFHHQDFLIEPFVIASLMTAFYNYLSWTQTARNKSLVFSITLFGLAFMQKIMYGPFLFIPLGWYYFRKKEISASVILKFIFSLIIPLLIYFIWQNQADLINISNNQGYFASSSFKHLEWNLGTLADRFSASLWQFRMNNILNGMFLKPGIIFFLIGIVSVLRKRAFHFFYIWFFAELLYFLLFFRIQSHIYYQMIIIPVTSVFMAAGILKLGNLIKLISNKYLKYLFIASVSAFYFWRSLLSSQWDLSMDLKWYSRLMSAAEAVRREKYGVLVNPGYDWNSVYTYYPKLKLLTISLENLTQENVLKWKAQGYSYFILHRYNEYSDFLKKNRFNNSLEFMDSYKKVHQSEDFKVYLINVEKI